MRLARALPFLAVIAVLSAGAGLVYSVLSGGVVAAGLVYGTSIGLSVMSFERGLVLRALRERIRRWPSLLYVPTLEALYLLLICLGFGVGGVISWALRLTRDSLAVATMPTPHVLAYSIGVSILLVFVSRVRDLLGRDVFLNFLIGRYHRPVEEERIFLFLDLVGSTSYARTHGDLRAQALLGAIFTAIAEPIRRHGGAIDDYVGDMALITWPQHRGLKDANCLRCVFAILDEFERDAAGWQRRFGQVPHFHAALHGGSVVTAEVGVDRHKISYFGDVVNTTARLEGLCRQLGTPVLISGELLARVPSLPDGIRSSSCGRHGLKGLDRPIEVFALERHANLNVVQSGSGTGVPETAMLAARGG